MSQAPARPLLIAHRHGNDLTKLADAFTAGVDYAETDVWYDRGRLEVRHEKTAGPLPFLWDRWYLKPGWTSRLCVEDVLARALGRGKLLLDLKGNAPELAGVLATAVQAANAESQVALTGGWGHLDRLAELLPGAPRFYSVGNERRLAAIGPRLARREVPAMSIDSRVVTAALVEELRDAGVGPIISWHVETAEHARALLSWGVSGITSGSLALLTAIREGRVTA